MLKMDLYVIVNNRIMTLFSLCVVYKRLIKIYDLTGQQGVRAKADWRCRVCAPSHACLLETVGHRAVSG